MNTCKPKKARQNKLVSTVYWQNLNWLTNLTVMVTLFLRDFRQVSDIEFYRYWYNQTWSIGISRKAENSIVLDIYLMMTS